MIRPSDIDDDNWDVICAAAAGDIDGLRGLLERNSSLSGEGYFYTPPIHFAVREGKAEAVRVLIEYGADAEWNGHYGESLIDMARDRGHTDVAAILAEARDRRGRTAPGETREDHAIHAAAQAGDLQRVRELLDADPTLVTRGDRAGGTPLHRAVAGSSREIVALLLDRGADIHAIHGAGLGSPGGFSPHDVQAIDIALWGGFGRRPRPPLWRILAACLRYWLWGRYFRRGRQPCDPEMARQLVLGCFRISRIRNLLEPLQQSGQRVPENPQLLLDGFLPGLPLFLDRR